MLAFWRKVEGLAKPLVARWLLLCGLLLAPTQAQSLGLEGLQTKVELDFSSALALNAAPPLGSVNWMLASRLELHYTLKPLQLNVVLQPGVEFGQPVITDAGLSEAYGLLRLDTLDLSAGVERIPLEYARLSLPYSLEPVSPLGNRLGLLGLRASWNPENTRLRLGLLQNAQGWFGLLSLHREFDNFELEAQALAPSGRPTFGLGGSATIENLVLYGEVWALTNPTEWRYALGLSGSLGDGLWTLEGGNAAPAAGQAVRHLLAGQITLPQDQDSSWNLLAQLWFDPDALRGQLGLGFTTGSSDTQLSVSAGAQIGPQPPALTLKIALSFFPSL